MPDLVLYHAVPSRSMTVHWMLEETGVPYDIELLNLDAEDNKRPEYLAEAFPQSGMAVPLDSPLRGEYLTWLFFAPVTVEPALLWRTLEMPADQEYQPFADLDTVAEVLRQALAGREFIVGDHFSAADVMIGSTIMWGTKLMPLLPRHPELLDYWARLEQRPAWQRSSAVDEEIMSARES